MTALKGHVRLCFVPYPMILKCSPSVLYKMLLMSCILKQFPFFIYQNRHKKKMHMQ